MCADRCMRLNHACLAVHVLLLGGVVTCFNMWYCIGRRHTYGFARLYDIHARTHTHTHVCKYILLYIQTCTHTRVLHIEHVYHTYIHTYIYKYIHTRTKNDTCMHAYIYTYIQIIQIIQIIRTYIHTYVHRYIHIYIQVIHTYSD